MRRCFMPLILLAALPAACRSGDEAVEAARPLLDEGRFVEARAALREALGARPGAGRRAAVLARAERECGAPEKALAALGGVSPADADLPEVREERIRALLGIVEIDRLYRGDAAASRNLEAAARIARALVKGGRPSPDRFLLAAEVERLLGRTGAARSYISEARAADADPTDAEVAELAVLAQADRTSATQRLEAVLRDHPDHAGALVTLAAIRGQAGDLEGARRLLGRATEAAPLDVRAAVALAGTLRDLGRPEEAAAALRPILEKRPDSLPVLRMLAHCLGAAGRWSEAVEVLRHANEVHPGIPGLMNDLGVALFEGAFWKNEWLSEAIRVHEEALRIAPGDVNNSYNLARAYTKLNKTEGLLRNIDLYEGIIARIQGDPRQVDLLRRCHRNVALILSDSFKRYEEAYAHYLEFFRLGGRAEDDPSGGILDDWGKVLEGLGKPYRAPPGPGESK